VDPWINRHQSDLGLDQVKETVKLQGGTIQIFCGQGIQRGDTNPKVCEPLQHLLQLLGTHSMPCYRVIETLSLGKPPVSIQDETDVLGHGAAVDVPKQPSLIEPIQQRKRVRGVHTISV